MDDAEQVHIKLGISGTYWDKRPRYRVVFNDTVLHEAEVSGDTDSIEYLEFDVEYSTDQAKLEIELLNKTANDTVENSDKSAIVNDLLLNIHCIEIDDIDLGMVPFNQSVYRPAMPVMWKGEQVTELRNCMNLGWNGTWSLIWSNPFYIWLLETM